MAATKLNFYIGAIALIAIVSVTFMIFGQAMLTHDKSIINDESKEYVADYSGYVAEANLDSINDTTAAEQEQSLTGGGNESDSFSISDVLAAVNFYSERVGQIMPTLRLVYNFPTFVVSSLNLPIEPFRHAINIIVYMTFISLLYIALKAIQGRD